MAIGRLSMKVGKAGKAGPHASYIAREGKYANRLENNEKLEATEAGNMPSWAQHDPQAFWDSADTNERKNGTTYREMEIALPRELSPRQRADLVRDFVDQEIGKRHAYQWAIHTPKAADGGEQPHVHLMFNERQKDNIERDPNLYFKRYNAKSPEVGGARKGYGPSAGLTLSASERKAELRNLRDRWEKTCNAHLEKAGVTERIDMRSHRDRETGLIPERKFLPSEWRDPVQRAKVIDFRHARRELLRSRETLKREIPDAGAEIISLELERSKRIQVCKDAPNTTINVNAKEHKKMESASKEASTSSKNIEMVKDVPSAMDQMKTKAIQKGHVKGESQKSAPSSARTVEQMRAEVERRKSIKDRVKDDPERER